jgi:HEPN domain-containing protein
MTPKSQERLFKREYAQVLLRIAEGDYESAKALAGTGKGRPENICYLAQQAIEKTLKAVLCWRRVPVPLVHDIGVLVAKLPQNVEPPQGYDLSVLTAYATVRRYEEGFADLTPREIRAVLDTAEQVLEWAKKEIRA